MPAGDNGKVAPRDPNTNRFVKVEGPPAPPPVVRPATRTMIGYVMCPAVGQSTNAWYLAKVELPIEVVERYQVEGRRCRAGDPPDRRDVQSSKIVEHLRNPEMIRDWKELLR